MGFTGDASKPFIKVSFSNLRTGEQLEFPFMPTTFTESVVVSYARQKILGMSHEQLQYSNTGNYTIPGLEFFFRAMPSPGEETTDNRALAMHDARNFLMSLCYPSQATSIAQGGPPRILFVWPNMVALTCVLSQLQITHEKFDRTGASQIYRANVNLEEVRDARILSEDVRSYGMTRDSEGGLLITEDFTF